MKREWKEMTLGEAADFTSKPRGLNVKAFEKVPFVPMELVAQGGTYVRDWVWKPGKNINSGNYFEKGDCLLAKITPCFENGKQGIARELPADFGYASTELISFRGREGLSNKYFLFYFVLESGVRRQITQKMEGATGRQRIPISVLKTWPISLPPLPEQEKIAAVLLKIQRAIETQDRMIQTLGDLKKSTLQHVFTRGLRGEKTKVTAIGEVPESWEVAELGEVCNFLSGGTPAKMRHDYWQGRIPWVSPKDMKTTRLREVKDHISEAGLMAGSCLAPKGAVFIVVRGMILVKDVPIALAEVPMAFNQDMKAMLPGDRCSSEFMLYALQAHKRALFQKVGRSAHGTRTIVGDTLATFRIPLASLEEQRQIALTFNAIEHKQRKHESKKAALQDMFKTVLNQLMSGKIRVGDLEIETAEVAG